MGRPDSQVIRWCKPGGRSQTTSIWASLLNSAGEPAAGTLAGTSTTAGVVPTDATAGFPTIDTFDGGRGFLSRVEISGGTAGATLGLYRWSLNDLLWKSGAHTFNAADTITAPPSYSGRVPGGTDYKGLEIWVEIVTAFTGNPTFTVTYKNAAAGTGRTATISLATPPGSNSLFQLPLQAGDDGVELIETVACTVASVGTFNVLVLRPLVRHFQCTSDYIERYGEDTTQLAEIYDTTALYPLINSATTLNTTNPELIVHITRGVPAAGEFGVDVDLAIQRETPAPASGGYGSRAMVVNK